MNPLKFAWEITAGFVLFVFGLACCGAPIFFILWLVYAYGISIGWVLLGVLPSIFAIAAFAAVCRHAQGVRFPW